MATQHINCTTFTNATILHTFPMPIRQQTAVTLYNGHSASIFVGDATITTSGATIGRTIPAATAQTFYVNGGDSLWGISAAGSAAGAIVLTYSA